MRDSRYHGGFDHPVRAFVIGVTLLVLLFGGFVVGVEAGKNPIERTGAAVRVVTTNGRVRTTTVPVPVVRTVINGRTRVVTLPGAVRQRVVVIHRHGKTIYAYAYAEIAPAAAGDTSITNSASTVYVPAPVTVTTPPTTVTSPPETVTVTETAPPPSSTDSSGTTQTGP